MRSKHTQWLVVAAAVIAVATPTVAAADPNPPSDYFVDETKLPFGDLAGRNDQQLWGVHKGAGYRIEVPANWNGDLVVYAHGFRGTGPELTVSNPSIRDHLLRQGYAWAASSYATNAYDVAQGVLDTANLTHRFNGLVGNPDHVYLMGHSMGGHITVVTVEQFPNLYDGALPMCGVLADTELFDFFLDYNVVAEAASGVDVPFPPPDDYLATWVPQITAQLGPAFPTQLDADGQLLKDVTEQRSGGERPLFDVAFISWANFLFTVFGDGTLDLVPGSVAGNVDTDYQRDTDPARSPEEQELNTEVFRLAKDPQGIHPNGLATVPPTTGDLRVPTLSLHTIGDLFVPFSMEQLYAQRVIAAGHGDLFVSRAIRDVGHCGFTTQEQTVAFDALVQWVEGGSRPAGDAILDPAAVASPTFGCTFTTTRRVYDTTTCP